MMMNSPCSSRVINSFVGNGFACIRASLWSYVGGESGRDVDIVDDNRLELASNSS
jgi:hypothetical protein